jgi:hypothetical protein
MVTKPRFSSDSPTATARASRSAISFDPMDLPRATPSLVAGDMVSLRPSGPKYAVSAPVTSSALAGSNASALTLTSRTTVPPAPTTAFEMVRNTSVGASGMATMATRCPFSTPAVTAAPTCSS